MLKLIFEIYIIIIDKGILSLLNIKKNSLFKMKKGDFFK